MLSLLIFLSAVSLSQAAVCSTAGIGPCLNGNQCPSPAPAQQCLADPTGAMVCCNQADVIANPVTTTLAPVTTTATTTCRDLLNPSTGVSDCPNRANLCLNAAYYDLMTQQCPRTCGRCTSGVTTVSPNCVDLLNPSTRVSDCPSRAYLCSNPSYLTLMQQQCPRTCGYCTGTVTVGSGTCADLLNPSTRVSDCPSRAYLCSNPSYLTLMQQQCPRTCGYCSG